MSCIDNLLYSQIESIVSPIIDSNASRYHRSLEMTVEEAKQEARIALMFGLGKYDYNDSRGGVCVFADRVIRNHFLKLVKANNTHIRSPNVCDRSDGRLRRIRVKPSNVSSEYGLFAVENRTPERQILEKDSQRVVEMFHNVLESNLTDRDRKVFRCKTDPPRGLRIIMIEECRPKPTIPMIGKHLGMSKNSVDWSIKRIRQTAIGIIRSEPQFSELIDFEVVKSCDDRGDLDL